MKKSIILFMVMCILFTFFSCSKNDTNLAMNSLSSDNESSAELFENVSYTPDEFTTEEEFFEFVENSSGLQEALKKRAKEKGLKENEIELYSPENIPEGFKFSVIEHKDDYYISYEYRTEKPMFENYDNIKKNTISLAPMSDPFNDPNETRDKIPARDPPEIASELNELGDEGYHEKYGLGDMELLEFEDWTSSYSVVWIYVANDAEECIKSNMDKLLLSETNIPGYYGKLVYYPGVEEPILFTVHWAEEDNWFQMDIPCEYTDPTSTENFEMTDVKSGRTYKIPKSILDMKSKIITLD